MAERKWTDEQKDAIYTKNAADGESCNILVNAAAGSGKTAVLVERIINKLIPSEENPNPIDVDRLLVVTFTNAAAAEMKERISRALSDYLERAEDEGDLVMSALYKKQISLLYNADITTIDAFCMKTIKENFHALGISPDFGIADNAQLALIADEAMEEMIEECYDTDNEDFLLLSEIYSSGKDDLAVADIIYEVYDFARAMPAPQKWMDEKAEMFLLPDGISKNPWIKEIEKKKNALLKEAVRCLSNAIEYMADFSLGDYKDADDVVVCNPPFEKNPMQLNWGSCYEIICYERECALSLLNSDWDDSLAIFNSMIFERWGKTAAISDKEMEIKDKELKVIPKELRDKSKSLLQKASELISLSLSEIELQLKERVYKQAKAIVNIVNLYTEKFDEKKSKKNVLDFSDIEHLCYKLFSENEEIANALKEKYEEILMDEYQDSNSLQEEIFSKISRGNNLFVVGDMKQSIYRFRRSDLTIFKEKSERFKQDENSHDRKIVLSKNFRSRDEVLKSINVVFERIMSDKVGDVSYDDEQSLNTGNESYENMNIGRCNGYMSECYLLESQEEDGDSEESISKIEIEADFIAKKITELKKSGFLVRDGDEYRKIQNKDITILMSSYKNVADVYISALNKVGIDCFAERGGYFDRNEIRLVMALVKIIQNPYQDIPLLGVLRSPIALFSDDELVLIRTKSGGLVYDSLKFYAEMDDELAKKCKDFIKRLEKWREYSKHMSSERILWTLYEETGIYAFAGAIFGGDEAQANLRLLYERAKQYEASGYKGLFHFIRYIKRLELKEENLSQATLVGEGNDVVRIMTIHKSKGLEFPVVFLAGCGKSFRVPSNKIQLHKELGFGLEEINPEENYIISTVAKNAVAARERIEEISEEERKLYVAMTRAKEKLIVTGVTDKKTMPIEKREANWEKKLSDDTIKMSTDDVMSANGYIDWIAPVARKMSDYWYYKALPYERYFEILEDDEAECENDETDINVEKFIYPYSDIVDIPTKISVTDLKSSEDIINSGERDVELLKLPQFMEDNKKVTAARLGTVIHYIMQKINLKENITLDYVLEFINELFEKREISKEEKDRVDPDKIVKFYNSELGERILKSKRIEREAHFETQIPISVFSGHENSEETVLLQGIIDCYFEEDDGIVLVDYKSDFYKEPLELVEKYSEQLRWYQYAIEKITGKKVKEKYIYMFYGNDAVLI